MDARPTAVEWRGQTADYAPDELAIMAAMRQAGEVWALSLIREWKALDPDAVLRDEPARRTGLIVLSSAAQFDERRNTSRVFPVTEADVIAAQTVLAEWKRRPSRESEPDQLVL